MEKETQIIDGVVASISEKKGLDTPTPYRNISIGVNKINEEKKFETVKQWDNSKIDLTNLKVGDKVKIETTPKELTNTKGELFVVHTPVKLIEHTPKESIALTGRLNYDIKINTVNVKNKEGVEVPTKVATFTLPENNSNETNWRKVQVWGDKKVEALENVKVGDTVTVNGSYGKEYESVLKDGSKEIKKDLIAHSVSATSLEKAQDKALDEKALKNKELLSNVEKGDFKAVAKDLKNGADLKAIKEEHLSLLPEAQRESIKSVIQKHEDGVEKKNTKGVKI